MHPSQTRRRGQHKPLGRCSVCKFNFRVQDRGLIHRHGRGNIPCPGSNLPPEILVPDSSQAGSSPSTPSEGSQSLFSQSQSGTSTQPPTQAPCDGGSQPPTHTLRDVGSQQNRFSYLQDSVCLLNHLPKASRAGCGSRLVQILWDLTSDWQTLQNWDKLFLFGRQILAKPSRGGRKANITKVIKSRLANADLPPPPVVYTSCFWPALGVANILKTKYNIMGLAPRKSTTLSYSCNHKLTYASSKYQNL